MEESLSLAVNGAMRQVSTQQGHTLVGLRYETDYYQYGENGGFYKTLALFMTNFILGSMVGVVLLAVLIEISPAGEKPIIPVDITVYNPVGSQTDSTPLITADGSIIDPENLERWIAVSRDLLPKYPYGTKVELICKCPYEGEWEVRDVMNSRYTQSVDILTNDSTGKYQGVIK